MTDIIPPISERSDKELLAIITDTENWIPEVVDASKVELIKRGVSLKKQERNKKSTEKFREKTKEIRAGAEYKGFEQVWIFLTAPVVLIPYITFLVGDSFIRLKNEGYKKMWKQRLILRITGNFFWFIVIYNIVVAN